MKHTKHILVLLLALALLAALAVFASAEDVTIVDSGYCGAQGDNLTWTLDSEGTLTIDGIGMMDDYGESCSPWYSHKDTIRKVIVCDRVTKIGAGAFNRCSILESATLNENLRIIGGDAFGNCEKLSQITIPNSVNYISNAFYGTPIYNDESNWKDGGFYVDGCLLSISDEADVEEFSIVSGTRIIGNSVFMDCSSIKNITIPYGVQSIGDVAFFCSGLESVEIPNSVVRIGRSAFGFCRLKSIVIPESVKFIGVTAFTDDFGLFGSSYLERLTIKSLTCQMDRDAIASSTTIYCHAGSSAEGFAEEYGMDYELVHFYEGETTYDWDNLVCSHKCLYCDACETEPLDPADAPTTPETPAVPDEPEKPDRPQNGGGFFRNVLQFFSSITDWIVMLLTFKF